MDLNQHLLNCAECGQSVNGHTIIKTAQDDWNLFNLGKKTFDALVLHKPVKFSRRAFRSNHLLDPKNCWLCGQPTGHSWLKDLLG